MDPLQSVLVESVKLSDRSRGEVPSAASPQPMDAESQQFLSGAFAQLQGFQPISEAKQVNLDLDMIENEDAKDKDKYNAFEDIKDIIAQIDNANNLENENRWGRLVKQLASKDPEIRGLAAECCGIAVQNNLRSQERVSHFSV